MAQSAVEAGTPAVGIEEYLRTSYRPDVEYLDGELKEKPVVGFPHGRAQGFLFVWFNQRRKEWNIRVAVETRTRVTSTRVRLPDLVVVNATERSKGTLEAAPLIAIEVLSPTDTDAELRARATDLAAMGTRNIWLVDPEERRAEVWDGAGWRPHPETVLRAVDSPMYLDTAWLWAELDD